MSVIDRLLGRLNRVFNRDPKIVPVITLARNAVYTNIVATDGNTYQLNIFSYGVSETSVAEYDSEAAITYDDNTVVETAPDSSGDIPGDYRPVFQRFDVPAGEPTVIASSGCFYNIEVYDNGDGTWSHGFIRLPGSGTFGPATFDAIDGHRYLLSFVDNGDDTWSDVYTRVFGQAGGLAPTTLAVKDLALSIEVDGQISIDLSTGTLADLVEAIGACTGFSASLVDPNKAELLARGLYEVGGQDLAADQTLYYPTALLYNEMQVHAWALMEQNSRQQDAERQLYMDTAQDDWLDYWGKDYFDTPRYTGESDDAYSQRIAHQILQATQNNVALEMIIKESLGIDVSVIDAAKIISELTSEEQVAAPGRIVLENIGLDHSWLTDQRGQAVAQVEDIVNRYRAAGTAILKHLLVLLVQPTESIATIESMLATFILGFTDALQPGPIRFGAGWKFGTPGLKFGNNDPIKEQIIIQKVSSLDGSITEKYLYGG